MPSDKLTEFPAADEEFRALRLRAVKACREYNALDLEATVRQEFLAYCKIINREPSAEELALPDAELRPLFPSLRAPVDIGYGTNLKIGASSFINWNVSISDNPIHELCIGERVLIGPYVQLHTVTHPTHWEERNGAKGPSLCAPITIGDDVWIGGGAIILPGVRIGERAVVGAGSLVTKDVPRECVVGGNPARVIRMLGEKSAEAEHEELEATV